MALPVPEDRLTPMEIERLSPAERAQIAPDGRRLDAPAPSAAPVPTVHMQIVGANPAATVAGVDPLVTKGNYFLGNDPNHWHTNVPTFGRVEYHDVYPGIDLAYYSSQHSVVSSQHSGGQLEYDFIVAPGADPTQIRLSFAGADNVAIDPAGDLVMQ